jgi:hypothetical protein
VTTPASTRAEIQRLEQERSQLTSEMEVEFSRLSRIVHERADHYRRRLSQLDSRIWAERIKLRAPSP